MVEVWFRSERVGVMLYDEFLDLYEQNPIDYVCRQIQGEFE